MLLLDEALSFHARVRPSAVAVIDEQQTWTFERLNNEATRFRAYAVENLAKRRLGISLGNTGEHIVALVGLAGSTTTGIEMDPKWTVDEIGAAIEAFQIEAMITDTGTLERMYAAGMTSSLQHAITVDGRSSVSHLTFEETLAGAATSPSGHVHRPEAIHLVAPTGGTSGRMKGIQLSHRATAHRFITQIAEFGVPHTGRYLAATPLYHGGARSMGLAYLYFGAQLHLVVGFDAERFLALARDSTSSFCVPTMLHRLLDAATEPLPPDFRLISAGSRLDSGLATEIRQNLSTNLFDYYASVDTGAIAVRKPGDHQLPDGCVGRPAFAVEVRIANASIGEPGQVEVLGPNLASGYEGDLAPLQAELAANGIVRPGDTGWMDDDGYLHLLGRSDDVIISGGVNVSPWEIERTIMAFDDVAAVAVIGVDDPEWSQRIVAGVVAADHVHSLEPSELRERLRVSLSPTKIPKDIVVVPSLPLTQIGKVDRRAAIALIRRQLDKGSGL